MRLILLPLILALTLSAPGQNLARAAEAPPTPTISVEAEGKVAAVPDTANLTLEAETQAPGADAAGQENARISGNLLTALKKMLGPEDKVQSLGYRLTPVYTQKDKSRPSQITAYQAVHRSQVQVRDLGHLGAVIDAALAHGATRITGPAWGHSRIEDLQREAAVNALAKARRLADALAQAAGVKIKGVQKISTGVRFIPLRMAEGYAAAKAAAPTPIEVGEEEIKATITAVFELAP